MKHLCSIVLLLAPCLAHEGDLLAEQQSESGAARIIHTIRGAEKALVKDLHGSPRFLLSMERSLHKASQLALRAGEMRAKQVHSMSRLHEIEASLMQNEQSSVSMQQQTSGVSQSDRQFASIASKEVQLLRGGRGILREVHVLKADVASALGQSDPQVTAQLELLMDKVGGAQKDILRSEAKAASHASKLAASIRKGKVPPAGAFAQETESMGTKDPVRRVHLAKEALDQLKLAKGEITAAYGTDAGKVKKVEAMVDQLAGSLQGLEESDQADSKENLQADEAAMFAKMEQEAHLKKVVKAAEKASLAQAAAHARMSKHAVAMRFRLRERHMQQLAQRTSHLAMEDHRISKEASAASRAVEEELGGTEAGEEVSALLRTAASEASRASVGDRRLAALEHKQVHDEVNMAAILAH